VADKDWEDEDYSDDDEDVTVPCPYCHKAIFEDVVQCPYCGNYISDEDSPRTRKPWWILIGAALAIYVAIRWITG
jgi:DNA-directed RNA polymerase subunit RPC12/RpoP